jgi:hypothetical protein
MISNSLRELGKTAGQQTAGQQRSRFLHDFAACFAVQKQCCTMEWVIFNIWNILF